MRLGHLPGVLWLLSCAPLAAQCPAGIDSLFASNNGGAVGGAVYFDITVANLTTITGFDVNTSVAVGNPIGMRVHVLPGLGVVHTDPGWAGAQVAEDDGTSVSAGNNGRTSVTLVSPFTLAAGSYTMAIVGANTTTGFTMNNRYTNGTGANQNYTDGNVTLALGRASNVPFSGSAFSPRVANIRVKYLSSDALTADFSATYTACGPGPLAVAFVDLSCTTDPGGITSWAWDFDNDGTVDSNTQNPGAVYTLPGSYSVRLTVTDASHPAATLVKAAFIQVGIPNDECATALALPLGNSGPYYTDCATTSVPAWPCAGTGGNDVWFCYTATESGTLVVNTCDAGTNYDTAIEAFSGPCGALLSVACNDDSCGLQSQVTITVACGGTYYIRVGGWNGARGRFHMNATFTPGGSGSFAPLGAPGCGGLTLTASGSPNLGGSVNYALAPVVGSPSIWFGLIYPLGVPVCASCTLDVSLDFIFPVSNLPGTIPCNIALVGGSWAAQGADLGGIGGCGVGDPLPIPFTLSNSILTTIGM